MKASRLILTAVAALAAATTLNAQTGFPFRGETLRYDINWPSGLGIGDATFTAAKTDDGWNFGMTLNGGIPGFSVADSIRSSATADLCSMEMERDLSHGSRKSREKTTFDQKKGTAERATIMPEGGGKTQFDIPACARDALTFLYFARQELGQGRVPTQQQVYFGSAYSLRMEYGGEQSVTVRGKTQTADRTVVHLKGPKADRTFEVFFARDAARTPLSVRLSLADMAFSMDLAP